MSYLTPYCQNLLQSNGNQVSEKLAEGRTYDKWNRIESRNKPIHLWSTDLNKGPRPFNGGREDWISTCKRSEVRPLPHTIYKINSKHIKYLNLTTKTIKLLGKDMCKSSWPWVWQKILDMIPKAWATKEKKKKTLFKAFCVQRMPSGSEKATQRMRENICKSYTWKTFVCKIYK